MLLKNLIKIKNQQKVINENNIEKNNNISIVEKNHNVLEIKGEKQTIISIQKKIKNNIKESVIQWKYYHLFLKKIKNQIIKKEKIQIYNWCHFIYIKEMGCKKKNKKF